MPTDTRKPRPKRVTRVLLAFVTLLIPLGGIGLYLLGREDPRAGGPPTAWGDRVERRLDAFIDGVRPEWTNRVEEQTDAWVDKAGPQIGRGMERIGIDPNRLSWGDSEKVKSDAGKAGAAPSGRGPGRKPGATGTAPEKTRPEAKPPTIPAAEPGTKG